MQVSKASWQPIVYSNGFPKLHTWKFGLYAIHTIHGHEHNCHVTGSHIYICVTTEYNSKWLDYTVADLKYLL